MSYTFPSDDHLVGDSGHTTDHNDIVDVLKGNARFVYSVLNTAYNGGADPTGTNDSTTAIQDALNAALSDDGGIVYIPAGSYKVSSTITANLDGASLQIYGEPGSVISYYGSGDCLRIYDSSTYSSRSYETGSGIFGFLVIDGTNSSASAASAGLHAGDIFQLGLNLTARNFSNHSGSVNVHLDNNYYWTEQLYGRIYAQNGSTNVMFDNSADTSGSATGSFERMNLDIFVRSGGVGDGVTFNNGAYIADHRLGIYGNFGTSTTQYAVLRLTGSNGGGSSRITKGIINIGCELDDDVHTAPYTIYFNAGGNIIQTCSGQMDFSLNYSFTASNNAGQFWYNGSVYGDGNLFPTSASTSENPQTISSDGSTIYSNFVSIIVASAASAYTGLILQAGVYSGQTVTIINESANSLTFAASGTSNVADGTSDVIASNTAATYFWNTGNSLWYRTV